MSFVSAAPELIESAAHDLSGIGSTLGEATHFAAAPTTSIAAAGADEVSVAIAALFSSHGQEFQALSAQAAAFHDEFAGLMKSGAGAYVSSEVANAGKLLAGGATAFENEVGTFGATVAAPYQSLFSTTSANLHTMESAISANPHPLLQQIIRNQTGYAKTIGTGFVHSIENAPGQLQHVPAEIQSGARTLSSINPEALAQYVLTNGSAHTITTSLGAAAHDFTTEMRALPGSFQTAFHDLATGNATGAVDALERGFGDLFLTGFTTTTGAGDVITVLPTGAVGDLLPILSIPGHMAQNFANLFPAGTFPAHLVQNFANVVKTVTNFNVSATANFVLNPNWFGVDVDATMGLPLLLALEALGGPANALNALAHSATTFVHAVQSGNLLGATKAVLDAPAAMANGFLNGQSTLPLPVDFTGLNTILDIPLDGILVPAAQYTATIPSNTQGGFGVLVDGTPIGGLLPGLLSYLPADLAAALGGPPAPVIPLTIP
jgi:hypothetical protein